MAVRSSGSRLGCLASGLRALPFRASGLRLASSGFWLTPCLLQLLAHALVAHALALWASRTRARQLTGRQVMPYDVQMCGRSIARRCNVASDTAGRSIRMQDPWNKLKKAGSTLRSSRAVPHPSTNRALRRLTSEVGRDPVYSTRYGRQRNPMGQAPLLGLLASGLRLGC